MPTQQARKIAVASPLGDDVLLFHRMRAVEEMGRLFEYELDLFSEEENINSADILGQNMTVRVELPNQETRYFNGYVSRFVQAGRSEHFVRYRATLRPWLWFLTRTADCRIFQEQSVPDIIKQVFRDHGFTDFEQALSGTYRTWHYCVQYRESDFDFVSRLMEQEGIYYYFKHENGKHTLVFADDTGSHEAYPGYEQIRYYPPTNEQRREEDHIYDWLITQEVQTGNYALNDFDFTRPNAALLARSTIQREHAGAAFEVYDYPGAYQQSADGDEYAKKRIEELQANYERLEGAGNAAGIAVGYLFELSDYLREDQNREYLVTATQYQIETDEYLSDASGGSEPSISCQFQCISSQTHYRSQRITPKPVVQGPQTAIVVGKAGEEIWTDEFGRVKVHFHWDRYGKADETSSCWVRVAQVWAGKKWGTQYIPRIGQEVIVEFLEGDPDRPIITGRVYNGTNMPPYDLPAQATKSTIKSNSSKGGGGFNELRLEDKKGSEQIFMHAEKDHDLRVKNDAKTWVGHDQHNHVVNDQFEKIDNESHRVVMADAFSKVDGNVNEVIGADRLVEVKANDHLTIAADQMIDTGGDSNLTSGGDHNHKVANQYSLKAGKDIQEKAGMNLAIDAGQNVHIKAGMNVVIEAGLGITLKVGGNFVALTPATVDIKGIIVNVNSGGSAGSGSGCSPSAPAAPSVPDEAKDALDAVDDAAGQVASAQASQAKKSSQSFASTQTTSFTNPQAQSLANAAQSGAPFCEKCEAAKQQNSGGR